MKFIIVEFNGDVKELHPSRSRIKDKPLGEILKGHEHEIEDIQVNSSYLKDWSDYKPKDFDEITIHSKTKDAFTGILINILLSIAFSFLASLFAPSPKKKNPSAAQPSFGIAGIQNTIAPGTPKFITYGKRRVFGHLIGSTIDIADDRDRIDTNNGRSLSYSALYYMGVGEICCISDIELNGTSIEDLNQSLRDQEKDEATKKGVDPKYTPVEYQFRLGTQEQTIISGHETVNMVYNDGRQLEVVTLNNKTEQDIPPYDATPIIYTTQGQETERVTLFFSCPEGVFNNGGNKTAGNVYATKFIVHIKRKRSTESSEQWEDLGEFYSAYLNTKNGFFFKVTIDNPDADRWDYYIANIANRGDGVSSFYQSPSLYLYNVMETRLIATAYPGNALLEVHGIANSQITSFDSLAASAIVEGRAVEVLNNGIYTRQRSRNRVWIVRDILLDPTIGLGNRISAEIWDDGAGLEAAQYYEELVEGYNETLEQRDYCDVIINDIQPGWDHIKTLLFEGRAALIPSGGKLKYILDKDQVAKIKYSSPGNIIEDTLNYQRGFLEPPINTIRADFPSEDANYKSIPVKLVSATRGTDPERTQTISFTSLVRESQVSREMNFRLKQATSIKRRWRWQTPKMKVFSEPWEVVKLSYEVAKALRGIAGQLSGTKNTSTQIVTGKEIYLDTGYTYSVFIKHEDELEERDVINSPGNTYSIINVSPPFSFTPSFGDRYSVNKKNYQTEYAQIDAIEFDGENFTLTAHEHIPAIYVDEIFDVTALENTSGSSIVPKPLLGVQALQTVIAGVTLANFTVIPAFNKLAGTYSNLTTTTVTLDTKEPAQDDLFNTGYIKVQSNAILPINDYNGTTREITTIDSASFAVGVSIGGTYEISWPTSPQFYGFSVEGGTQSSGPFSSVGITPSSIVGTSLTTTYSIPEDYTWFRFTPYDQQGVQNTVGRWIVDFGQYDTTATIPPAEVDLFTTSEPSGVVSAFLTAPLDRDLKYLEIQVLRNDPVTGDLINSSLVDLSSNRDDTLTTTIVNGTTVGLTSESFGTLVYSRAATIDFFGNKSDYAIGFTGSTLSSSVVPTEITLLEDLTTIENFTGSSLFTVYSKNINGGTLSTDESIELVTQLFITPGSTTSTSIDFSYTYSGVTFTTITANIANGTTAIGTETPYWLRFNLEANGSVLSQLAIASKYGEEVPADWLQETTGVMSEDAGSTQPLVIYGQITGDTTSIVTRKHAILKQLLNG